ncbi:C40 family peptidase [Pelovirga terrestris]|nr:NlpC/P60 family protein [Pelovirga terrestris]
MLTMVLLVLVLLLLGGCSRSTGPEVRGSQETDPIAALLAGPAGADEPPAGGEELRRMGYAVQVGAFAVLENAVGLEASLARRGIDAYYFRAETGLYKVQFGNYTTYEAARTEAQQFRQQSLIDSFFIAVPDQYSVARIQRSGRGDIREELVITAQRFLGVPYRWGGEDKGGFDCSGLTMVSYRLNGLDLPRNSRAQFDAGRAVAQQALQRGDLVFFATQGGRRVTHVGIYIGNDQFIHAPRAGQTVRVANLSSNYFKKTYVGARTYL